MAHDREVAGVRCTQVLERLHDYVDGQLDAAHKAQVDAHLAGCDWCERFGDQYAGLAQSVRDRLGEPNPVPAGISARLIERLRQAAADPTRR